MASAGKVRAGQAFVELILASKEFDKGLKNIRTNMASFGKAIAVSYTHLDVYKRQLLDFYKTPEFTTGRTAALTHFPQEPLL